MKKLHILTFALLIFCGLNTLHAQTDTTEDDDDGLSLDKSTINDQFEYVLKKSGNFKGTNGQRYEAVNRNMLTTLQAHANDSLKTIRKDLNDTQAIVNTQAKEITELKTNLTNTQSTLDKTNSEKNNMALFGLQMSKTSYNILMWSVIAGLLALLLFFIYKFNNSNATTREAKKNLAEIEEEFEEHRRTALEREQKVRRQLQDELNKQKGIS